MNKEDASSVNDFNQIAQKLQDMRSGIVRKPKTPEDVNKLIQDFKINFPKKQKKMKVKNFERAQ